MSTPVASLKDRIAAKYVVNSVGCWMWRGGFYRGDPYIHKARAVGGGTVRVHVELWEQVHGKVPPGLTLIHACHTRACVGSIETCPHRRCVNPDHLQVITVAIMRRGVTGFDLTGWCRAGLHEIATEADISHEGQARYCRACRVAYRRNHRINNRKASS